MSDYLELGDCDADYFSLIVYGKDGMIAALKRVNGSPVRYQGMWSIPVENEFGKATVLIEDAKVLYFMTYGYEYE